MKLSHTSVSKYSECGEKYNLHYNKKLRDDKIHSALIVGKALDSAQNILLLDKKNNTLSSIEKYKDIFEKNLLLTEHNKNIINTFNNDFVVFSKYDFDPNLIYENDLKHFKFKSVESLNKFYKYISYKKNNREPLNSEEKEIYNKCNWLCSKNRGMLMLDVLYNDFLPTIKEVLEVQKIVQLKDEETGDTIDGVIDAILDFGEGPVVVDLKTSSMKYERNSASESPQLAVYRYSVRNEYKTNKVAFVVCYKKIEKLTSSVCSICSHKKETQARSCDNVINEKRCKSEWKETYTLKCNIEFIPGVIEEHFENSVLENYHLILKAIKSDIYYKNWQACKTGYGFCPYYNKCRNGSNSGLIDLK